MYVGSGRTGRESAIGFFPEKTRRCIYYRPHPANTKHLYNMCTVLDQRLRRWSNIVHMFCAYWEAIARIDGWMWPLDFYSHNNSV